MPSAGRRSFELSVYSAYANGGPARQVLQMVEQTIKGLCPADWKSVVKLDPGNINDASVSALNNVYLHKFSNGGGGGKHPYGSVSVQTDPYGDRLTDFMKFRRNFLEHGGQHNSIASDIEELELCLAKNFGDFFPNLLLTLGIG